MTAESSGVVPTFRQGASDVVLRARGLHRSFGLTHALRGIDLDVTAGRFSRLWDRPALENQHCCMS